jgi:Zn-dependent peptidase ImmA (M78 family)
VAETIEVKPEIIRWAIHRSGRTTGGLVQKFPQIQTWESDLARLTLVELEKLAAATLTPLGYFFLPKPPVEELPIPDFRTVKDMPLEGMSPDLIETVNTMVMRQDWYRDYLRDEGVPELDYIGSATLKSDIKRVAHAIKVKLGLEQGWAARKTSWTTALSHLRDCIEAIDIVMVTNSVVGNNNRRRLSVDEFRGFVLCDKLAPLIFVNGSDAKSAQVFTIFHELAHLWLGKSAIFDDRQVEQPTDAVEKFCNAVAAEAAVPTEELKRLWPQRQEDDVYFSQLSRYFKVSPITIGRRLIELDLLTKKAFFAFYEAYQKLDKTQGEQDAGGGGNFYFIQNNRVGKRFARAVASAAYEGKLSYPDAFRLTGLTAATFDQYLAVAKGRKG